MFDIKCSSMDILNSGNSHYSDPSKNCILLPISTKLFINNFLFKHFLS